MEAQTESVERRLTAVMREGERVTPLELFFDLVFVLALTQCTTVMVESPTWKGIAQGLVVLALLWWTWTGYAWLTSVVDPEEGVVRLVLLAAMAALLISALSAPQAYGDRAVEFALAYAVVRAAHVALFALASRDDPLLRRSVVSLGASTGAGVALLVGGAVLGGTAQAVLWIVALLIDVGGPYFFRAEGWRLAPGHFAERHGLVVIIALGESIVALGVGADLGLTLGVTTTAVLGVVIAFELWWIYFDVVAIANVRRLVRAPVGREQNEMARDVYSYLHFPLVAGIVLVAFGLHEALEHYSDPLETVPAFGLLGGVAVYLLGHVAVRLRGAHTLNRQRLLLAIVLLALIPAAAHVAALVTITATAVLLGAMIAYETNRYGPGRVRIRHEFAVGGATRYSER